MREDNVLFRIVSLRDKKKQENKNTWYPLRFLFKNFQRAPPSLFYGSSPPPPGMNDHRSYLQNLIKQF